jgi:hypothetical protein
MNGQQIVDAVVNEGGFDTSSTGIDRATVAGWVADRYRDLVVRAKWLMAIQTIATTVAQQADYALSDSIVEVEELKVGGMRYSAIGVEEMWDLDAARLELKPGFGGVFAPTYDAAGVTKLSLFPEPVTAGDAIDALVVLPPADFTDSSSFAPAVPTDFHRKLVDGAIAEGLAKIDERLNEATFYEQRWEATVEALARRKRSRVAQPVTTLRVSRRPR